MDLPPISAPATAISLAQPDRDRDIHAAAEAFEAAFLAEMLKHSGINETPSFGGGAGEDAFSSMLTQEYASLLAKRGGLGLAEHVFEVLKQRTTGQ